MRKKCCVIRHFVAQTHYVTQVIELNPSFYLGYELKHAALHGGQRYDEAIETIENMVSKLSDTSDTQTQGKSRISHASKT